MQKGAPPTLGAPLFMYCLVALPLAWLDSDNAKKQQQDNG